MNLKAALNDWGWLVALAVAVLALAIVYTRPTDVIPATTSEKVVPASGPEGFPVEVFCKDDATQVKAIPNPDADGITYQLMRVRSGVPEAVVWANGINADNLGATHYWYDDQKIQQSEAAVVTPGARRCIEDKAT